MDETTPEHQPLSPESFARSPLPVLGDAVHHSPPTSLRVDPPLETERLVIREFRREDLEAVHSYASDPEVVRFLREEGCHLGQGYLWTRPVPADEVPALLKPRARRPAIAAV